jgi:acyl-CoA thioesterase FadM
MTRLDYRIIEEVFAPSDGELDAAHVVDYEVQRLLSEGWQQYVALIRAVVPNMPAPVVRNITTAFETECRGGDRLLRGVRAVSHTRRSYLLDEALWHPDSGRIVATSEVVMTGIDRSTGKAAEVSTELWNAVVAIEGESVSLFQKGE